MKYRREIDGLRALAVIPVILFHAGFQKFSGGFVGVDVFFVISGYLITSIILLEKQAGTFTLFGFYERRARRILPALFLVMFVCLPFAWLWLMPADMKSFSESLVAVSSFSSNILFWRQSGYFDAAAELKPLLHTWSLAVEEQYYALFPIFLLLTWRLGKRITVSIIAVVAVISLAAAQWLVSTNPSSVFFLLPTRVWEILIGALIAFYVLSRSKKIASNSFANQALSFFGLLLIIYSVFTFDKNTPYPSLFTLVPTFGAALIILFATSQSLVGKALGSKIFVGVGLISYSAYLWHQPLFAFSKHRSFDEPGLLMQLGLSCAAVALAYFSWRYVETPFRDRRRFTRKRIFLCGAFCCIFFVAVGLAGYFTNGFESRITGERGEFLKYFENSIPELKYFEREGILEKYRTKCDFYDLHKYRAGSSTKVPLSGISKDCFVRNYAFEKSVFIWGDSHAQQLYPGLKQALPSSWQILQVTSSGCEARLRAKMSLNDYCEYSNWFAYKAIVEIKPDVVIIGQNLNHDVKIMSDIGDNLKSIGVKKVIFTGPTPHWRADLPKIIANKFWDKTPHRTFSGIDFDAIKLDKNLKIEFPKSKSAEFVSIIDYFCNEIGCVVYFGDSKRDGITTWDYGHLTPIASYYFAKDVLVKKLMAR